MPYHYLVPNPRQNAAQSFCQSLISSPKYRADLRVRLEERTLHPAIEQMIWHYAVGKPVATMDVTLHDEDLTQLSNTELAERTRQLLGKLAQIEDSSMAGAES